MIPSTTFPVLKRLSLPQGFSAIPAGPRQTRPLPSDAVLFSGRKELFEKYNIDPKAVDVVAPPGVEINKKQIPLILSKLLEAHEHALKNKAIGNFSGRHFSTNLLLEDGIWGLATSLELTRETSLCAERGALVKAWNKALKRLSLASIKTEDALEQVRQKLKVKMLVMSSSAPLGDPSVGFPCGECQGWMAADKYFSPETLLIALRKREETGQYYLVVRKLDQVLPLLSQQTSSLASKPIAALKPVISDKAGKAMADHNIPLPKLYDMMKEAQNAFETNKTASFSGKNTGVGVLLSNGKIESGARLDWTQRWFAPPDLTTAATAYQKYANQAPPVRIQAVAYYGKDEQLPPVANLGVLAQPARGGVDTLILTVKDDTLHIRTIEDYSTDIYISKFTPKE